ncbi:unnamed protein product, partial [Mesorhabditis belari]|uniref:Uncharacterized protein n=1 Tax=Mesorhabditis belari TaxID=2138241 RepID=A0AAF3J7R2_9BILA
MFSFLMCSLLLISTLILAATSYVIYEPEGYDEAYMMNPAYLMKRSQRATPSIHPYDIISQQLQMSRLGK